MLSIFRRVNSLSSDAQDWHRRFQGSCSDRSLLAPQKDRPNIVPAHAGPYVHHLIPIKKSPCHPFNTLDGRGSRRIAETTSERGKRRFQLPGQKIGEYFCPARWCVTSFDPYVMSNSDDFKTFGPCKSLQNREGFVSSSCNTGPACASLHSGVSIGL